MYKFENIIDNSIVIVPNWDIEGIAELEHSPEYIRIYEVKETSSYEKLGDEWIPF